MHCVRVMNVHFVAMPDTILEATSQQLRLGSATEEGEQYVTRLLQITRDSNEYAGTYQYFVEYEGGELTIYFVDFGFG